MPTPTTDRAWKLANRNAATLGADAMLEIPKGNVTGHAGVNKFGTNEDISTVYEHIWDYTGTWTQLPAATTLEVASSDANDTSAGTGARTLVIEGLDASYAEISDTVTFQFFICDQVNAVSRVNFEGAITNTSFVKDFKPYARIPEKFTLFVRAKADSGNVEVSAGFDLILVDSDA